MFKLNQRGITLFEISIITLIVLLVMISAWVIIARIQNNNQSNYNKVKVLQPSDYYVR